MCVCGEWMESGWRVSVWRVYGECMESVWRVYGVYGECIWKMCIIIVEEALFFPLGHRSPVRFVPHFCEVCEGVG